MNESKKTIATQHPIARIAAPELDRLMTTLDVNYLMLTECGLVSRLQVETPEKSFIGGCRLCPYMKMNTLEKVRDALLSPRPDQIITLDEDLRRRAARCIERMFELAPAN